MARAAPVAGQDEAAFQTAIEAWLQGDEQTALPALARLAAAGNPAARIHLALIDTTPAYQGAWLASLPRDQRIALLRAPGGLSGQGWMQAAAETEPLARAWLALWDGGATAQVVLDFAVLGEMRAAHMAARQLFIREKRGFGALADDPAYPPQLLALAIRDWQDSDPARAAQALRTLEPGDPSRRILGEQAPRPQDLLVWARHHPLAQNLIRTLDRLCPDSPTRAEDLAAYLGQSGGFWVLAWSGPPSESLIEATRYAASPKAAETALALLRQGPPLDPETLRTSPCLMALHVAP